MGDVIRHPSCNDVRNAKARAAWAFKYYGGVHFADLRTIEQYRQGEWLALQASWRRRGNYGQAISRTLRGRKV